MRNLRGMFNINHSSHIRSTALGHRSRRDSNDSSKIVTFLELDQIIVFSLLLLLLLCKHFKNEQQKTHRFFFLIPIQSLYIYVDPFFYRQQFPFICKAALFLCQWSTWCQVLYKPYELNILHFQSELSGFVFAEST